MRDLSCGAWRIYLELEVRRLWCRSCTGVKRESLEFLADNPFYTKRFAYFVGRRCRDSSVKAVAEELYLDWHSVKELDKQYMAEQLRRAGPPAPTAIGIDEIAIGKGHSYRIVVSDLIRGRPIWFGGKDRSEASMDEFFAWLGARKIQQNPPGGHGHVEGVPHFHPQGRQCPPGRDRLRQVSCAASSCGGLGPGPQERIRPSDGRRAAASSRAKSTRCCRAARTSPCAERQALKTAVQRQQASHTAYLLKESFEQLWSYETRGGRDASSTTGGPPSSGNG